MSDEILEKLKKLMNDITPNDDISLEDIFSDNLDYDSLDMIALYFATEEAFNIKIPESDLAKQELATVQQYLDFIKGKLV